MTDVYTLPVTNTSANYEFTTELEGVAYNFYFRYNNRMGKWVMSISDINETPIAQGLPVNVDVDFLGPIRAYSSTLPPGFLLAFNLENDYQEGGRDDFGVNLIMTYQESE